MTRVFLILTLLALIAAGCGSTPPTATEAVTTTPSFTPIPTAFPTTPVPTAVPNLLYVNPAMDMGAISPYIYGSNYGPWVAVPYTMIQSAFDSGITILRFPGGSWGDNNDVMPQQIDQFMAFINKMGATAMIDVRLKNGTPAQAAQLVQYVNITQKYNVKYWGIGNEPSLYSQELKDGYDTVRFNKDWRAIAEAMKAVDPSIKLVGPEIHQFSYSTENVTNYSVQTATDSSGRYWMDEFLKANGDLVDVVSFHRYPFPVSQVANPPTIDELRNDAPQWSKIIDHLRDLIHKYTGRDLPVAVTEFSSATNKAVSGEATADSLFHAIWMADVLGQMIRENVFMVNYWLLTSSGDGGGSGLIGRGVLRPSYYVYQMYKMFGNEQIYASSDDPYLTIYAAKRADGALTLVVVNLKSEEQTKPIQIEGQSKVQAEAWLLDSTHNAADIGSVDISGSITVPAQSMTLYIVQP